MQLLCSNISHNTVKVFTDDDGGDTNNNAKASAKSPRAGTKKREELFKRWK
uniref:Uncharacterized protein n=1 Tax=Nelumbo nucifera TaxID=4432 RepID=A0A822Y6P8_NELNU|nr:TPA_asm: hypothetical protein HUJ06_028173 [Nelumbo nucifera]